ncbi:hypothetical protein LTR36_006281 [Oleoguttula mirabilis]|uniref:Gfo/Idh/MocA-like oxidoreductase N-terminal domain-containing protein n=1 Tax=Oleoguttula mirabilis TaxID=1507867 RepID=A0AAV9JBX6_9PEZI|nr:hypothetical protein LTR36_006281 [Oleoguttula mirabilis]
MARIRLALIGLSQSAKTSWARDGHLPYLLSERGRERYKIAALLNSSEEAAQRAIDHYELGADVAAYGSPQALAEDPNIDLVVCTTRVDVHYGTIRPSLEAGKSAFVEWPLAESLQRASELADLARERHVRTIVGLQARVAPVVLKIKELLEAGTIGQVLSSDVSAATPLGGGDSISEGLAYFMDKKVGGNAVTIAFGHTIDYVHFVLGEYASSQAHWQIQRPNQTIVNRETGAKRLIISDVPDLVSLHGTLQPSRYVAEGASLVVHFRSGPPFPGTTAFAWTITGQKGEIRVSSERGPSIQVAADDVPVPIEVHDFATGEVKQVEWTWEEWQGTLSARGRNIGKVYDLLYEGRVEKSGVANFETAAVRHRQLNAMLSQ